MSLKNKSTATELSKPAPESSQGLRPTISQVIFPFWRSEEKYSAFFKLFFSLAMSFVMTKLMIKASMLAGEVIDAMVGRNWEVLWKTILLSTVVGLFVAGLSIFKAYIDNLLDLQWRVWLTEQFVQRWTDSCAFYDIEREGCLSNTDQRISEDVKLFTNQTLSLFMGFASAIVMLGSYGVFLWQQSGSLKFELLGWHIVIPGYMFFLAFIYVGVQFLLMHWVGKKLIQLNYEKQTVEADYRYAATQLRDNAEQIAFYAGGARERRRLQARFAKVKHNTIAILIRTSKVLFVQDGYGRLVDPVPTLAALPRYFSGEISMGGLTQVTGAFNMFMGSLSLINQSYIGITAWLAISHRLQDLSESLNQAHQRPQGIEVHKVNRTDIGLSAIELHDPQQQILTNMPAQQFKLGERWLITGPSGTGKSTLLRAIAGLWPYGKGSIELPEQCKIMFLPQRSYIPDGDLKAALAYPSEADQFSEQQYLQVLEMVGLTQFQLTDVEQWRQKLSGGEQQRLAFARVLLHRPDYLFLDEATSALDEPTEAQLYQLIMDQLVESCVVSVAHRSSLRVYHQQVLEISPYTAVQDANTHSVVSAV